ncbi:cytochrome P450 [Actinomadura rugatobispora]|uniref:Cytochrome P450 n=1 Tax=Actinomadura rugatobispora TaxID=1994 RepID=A0ABW0ZRX4_9ACTN|nr:cytochrome P450 [Actinomadura rugatobispora]
MTTDTDTDTVSDYPMARTCPFDPPPEVLSIQERERITRVRLWDGSQPWLVTGYREVRDILSDPRVSADTDRAGYPWNSAGQKGRRGVMKTFINMDNPEHDRLRRMLTREFMVKRMRALRPEIEKIVNGLIDDILAGPNPADLVEALALPVPSLVICEMMGVSYEERHLFHELSRTMISRLSTAEEAVAAMQGMMELLARVVDEKDKAPADDLVSRLVTEQMRTGRLSRDEVVNMCQLLLVAGHETTANMIALGTLTFLRNPQALKELRTTDDAKVHANSVEEMLRYLTILHVGRRRVATEDFEFHGHQIKSGDGIVAAHDAADRDAGTFENPDVLDIHRPSARHHLAFGYGPHQCLGQPLARVELEVVYSTLYRRIPTLELAVPMDHIVFKTDNVVYGIDALPVKW